MTEEPTAKRRKESSKEKKTDRRERRKASEDELRKLLPGVDMSKYNKQQIRRMRKRVARGLNPLETPKEEHERKARDAQLRREEEAELADQIIQKPKPTNPEDDDIDNADNDSDTPPADNETLDSIEDNNEEETTTVAPTEPTPNTTVRGKNRSKPVPDDYTCFACKNACSPPHWIYDCPNKKTVRGTNQVSKKKRGLRDPSKNKLFVSGLPFETTIADVRKLVTDHAEVTIQSCRLVKFPDSSRCKGQAYVFFNTPEEAAKAKETLNGMVVPEDKKSTVKRKELRLRVADVLNRSETAKRKRP